MGTIYITCFHSQWILSVSGMKSNWKPGIMMLGVPHPHAATGSVRPSPAHFLQVHKRSLWTFVFSNLFFDHQATLSLFQQQLYFLLRNSPPLCKFLGPLSIKVCASLQTSWPRAQGRPLEAPRPLHRVTWDGRYRQSSLTPMLSGHGSWGVGRS